MAKIMPEDETVAEKEIIETDETVAVPVDGEQINVWRSKTVEPDYEEPVYERAAAAIKRVSWGAIFAGVVIALVLQLALSILGLGIGASTINPVTEQNPMAGFGTGAGIWFIITILISLFAGGWVAGRLAGMPRAVDSLLHGTLTWGLATLLLFYFLTSTVGAIIGGTFRTLGAGLSAAGSGVAAVAPDIANAAQNQMEKSGVKFDLSLLRSEIEKTLKQTNKPALQPGAIENKAGDIVNQTEDAASDAASDPANSDSEVSALLERIQQRGAATIDAADSEALVNVVMARTGKTRPEAQATVASYEKTYQQLQTQYAQAKVQAEQTTREVGQATADGVSSAALWAFAALLLSAIAATLGGYLATPKDIPARRTTLA